MGVGRASRTPVTYPFEKAFEATDGELWLEGATENERVAATVALEASQVLLEVELSPRVLTSSSPFTLAALGSCEVVSGRIEGPLPELVGKLDTRACDHGEGVDEKPESNPLEFCGCEDRGISSDSVVKKLLAEDEEVSFEADMIKTVGGIAVKRCWDGRVSPARILSSEYGAFVRFESAGGVNGSPVVDAVG